MVPLDLRLEVRYGNVVLLCDRVKLLYSLGIFLTLLSQLVLRLRHEGELLLQVLFRLIQVLQFALITQHLFLLPVHFQVQILVAFGKVFDLTRQFLDIDLEPIGLVEFASELPVKIVDLDDSGVQMLLCRL